MQKELDSILVGALQWYLNKNFSYPYRGRINHNIDLGPHALSYYIPGLLHAYKATGNKKYLENYERLHQQYFYNPEWALADNFEMPEVPSHRNSVDRFINIHIALRWGCRVGWLSENAPNSIYYKGLLEEFIQWNHRLLSNNLKTEGLGHDQDNMVPSTLGYPPEWLNQPFQHPGKKEENGGDIYCIIDRACFPAFRKLREQSYFSTLKPDLVDSTPILETLRFVNSPDHFTYWYDPEDRLGNIKLQCRSWALQAQFTTAWLTAYWRLRRMGKVD